MERSKKSCLYVLIGCSLTIWLLLFIAHGAMFDSTHLQKYKRSLAQYYDRANNIVYNDVMQNTINDVNGVQQSIPAPPQKVYAVPGQWDGRLGYRKRKSVEGSYQQGQRVQVPAQQVAVPPTYKQQPIFNDQQAWNPYVQQHPYEQNPNLRHHGINGAAHEPNVAPNHQPPHQPVPYQEPHRSHQIQGDTVVPWNPLYYKRQQEDSRPRQEWQNTNGFDKNQEPLPWSQEHRQPQNQGQQQYPEARSQLHSPGTRRVPSNNFHGNNVYPARNDIDPYPAESPDNYKESERNVNNHQPDMRQFGKSYKGPQPQQDGENIAQQTSKIELKPAVPPVSNAEVSKPGTMTKPDDSNPETLKELQNLFLLSKSSKAGEKTASEVTAGEKTAGTETTKKVVFKNVQQPPALKIEVSGKKTTQPEEKVVSNTKNPVKTKDSGSPPISEDANKEKALESVEPDAMTAMAFLHQLALYSHGFLQNQESYKNGAPLNIKPEATTQATLLMLEQGRERNQPRKTASNKDTNAGDAKADTNTEGEATILDKNAMSNAFLAAMQALADIVNNMHTGKPSESIDYHEPYTVAPINRLEVTTPPLYPGIKPDSVEVETKEDLKTASESIPTVGDSGIKTTSSPKRHYDANSESNTESYTPVSVNNNSITVIDSQVTSRTAGDAVITESVTESSEPHLTKINDGMATVNPDTNPNKVDTNVLDEDPLAFIERIALQSTSGIERIDDSISLKETNSSVEESKVAKEKKVESIKEIAASIETKDESDNEAVFEESVRKTPNAKVESNDSEVQNTDISSTGAQLNPSVNERFENVVKKYNTDEQSGEGNRDEDGRVPVNDLDVSPKAVNQNEDVKTDNNTGSNDNREFGTEHKTSSAKHNKNSNYEDEPKENAMGTEMNDHLPKTKDDSLIEDNMDGGVTSNLTKESGSSQGENMKVGFSSQMFNDSSEESSGFGDDEESEGLGSKKEMVPGMIEVTGEPLVNPIKDKKKQEEFRFILKRATNRRKEVMLVFFDGGYFDFALNFAEMSVKPNDMNNVVFISLDSSGCLELRALYMWCFVTSYDNSKIEGSRASSYGDDEYWMKVNARHIYVLEALLQGYTVMHVDPDVYLFSNPFTHFRNSSADIQGMIDGESTMNIGFIYIKPTRYSIGFFSDFVRLIAHTPTLNEQGVFNMLLGMIASSSDSFDYTYADPEMFVNGKKYYDEAKRYFNNDHSPCKKCVAVHNNHIIGKAGKIYRFKENLQWGVDKDNYYSDPNRKYLMYGNPVAIENAEKSLKYEIAALRDALAIGSILNRTLILPRFHCGGKSECPLNSYLLMKDFNQFFGGQYRENVFLDNQLVPDTIKDSQSKLFYIDTNSSMTADLPENTVELTSKSLGKVSADEITDWFSSVSKSILKIHSLYATYIDFVDVEEEEAFNTKVMKAFKRGTYEQNPL